MVYELLVKHTILPHIAYTALLETQPLTPASL